MANAVVLVVGTRKGLFLLRSDERRDSWQMAGPFLNGTDITHATIDRAHGTLYATAQRPLVRQQRRLLDGLGPDAGAKVNAAPSSPRTPDAASSGSGASSRAALRSPACCSAASTRAASSAPRTAARPGSKNAALNNHPTRDRWFPGAGGLIVHSIVLDPVNANRMWVAISAAGVFRTRGRAAQSWQPMNSSLKNILAKYDPNAETLPRGRPVRAPPGPRCRQRRPPLRPDPLGHLPQR